MRPHPEGGSIPDSRRRKYIDLLLDARGGLTFFADDEVPESSLMKILKRVDASFDRSKETFRAVNRDGYLVDLIKPMAKPSLEGSGPIRSAPIRRI